MDELLPWDPAHPLCALANRCDVLAAAWNRYRDRCYDIDDTLNQYERGYDIFGAKWWDVLGGANAKEFAWLWHAVRPLGDHYGAKPPGIESGDVTTTCLEAVDGKGSAAYRAVADVCQWFRVASSKSSWHSPFPIFDWHLDEEISHYPAVRYALLDAGCIAVNVGVPQSVWQRVTVPAGSPPVFLGTTGQPADLEDLLAWLHGEQIRPDSPAAPYSTKPANGFSGPHTPKLDDGPGGPLEFNFGGETYRFEKSEGRFYRLLVAMWPSYRLCNTLRPEQITELYFAAGGSNVEWDKLKEYAATLNLMLAGRLRLRSVIEYGPSFMRWSLRDS